VAVGAVAMSFAPVLVRLTTVSADTAAFYRLAVGGTVLAAVSLRTIRFDLGTVLWGVMGSAGLLFALDLAFWHRSIHYVGPGLATILGNFQVFFVALFGWAVLRERIGSRYVLGTLMAFGGLALFLGDGWARPGTNFRPGVIFGLLTALVYAAYLLVLRQSQSLPQKLRALPNMAIISLIGMIGIAIALVLQGESIAIPSPRDGVLLVGYGLVGQVFAWVSISKGLPLIPASRASLILLVQPCLAFVWDVVLLGRPTSQPEIAGALLAVAGIYLGMRR
jgi:drug/metabolite transporter (DMT)-like permease